MKRSLKLLLFFACINLILFSCTAQELDKEKPEMVIDNGQDVNPPENPNG